MITYHKQSVDIAVVTEETIDGHVFDLSVSVDDVSQGGLSDFLYDLSRICVFEP